MIWLAVVLVPLIILLLDSHAKKQAGKMTRGRKRPTWKR